MLGTSSHGVLERDDRRETIIGWIVVIVLVGSMFVRAWISIALYDNPGRGWRYRTLPYVPAQAYSSTRPASRSTNVEKQVPLPPAERKKTAR